MIEKIKSAVWNKIVEIAFKQAYKEFVVSFENADAELVKKPIGEKQQYYFSAHGTVENGVMQKEIEVMMQSMYKESALGDISVSERASKRYAIIVLSQLLKRVHDLAMRAKPATADKPINQQI